MNNPNSFEDEVEDATIANPIETSPQGTEEEEVDYKSKFTHSSQEAIRLKKENDRLLAELDAKQEEPLSNSTYSEDLIPNFSDLDEEAQNNLLVYTKNIERNVRNEINKDPALAFARGIYNEKQWDDAFHSVSEQYPELQSNSADFKSKYFNPNNVPENISEILQDVAKIYLFDTAKELGASEERKKAGRLEIETSTGGDRTPVARRSLADWNELAQTNPAKFASLSAEYEEDSKKF
jgi:hypothetical protein